MHRTPNFSNMRSCPTGIMNFPAATPFTGVRQTLVLAPNTCNVGDTVVCNDADGNTSEMQSLGLIVNGAVWDNAGALTLDIQLLPRSGNTGMGSQNIRWLIIPTN
jgi:hypothetical protein